MSGIEKAIAKAIDRYNSNHPRLKVKDVATACENIAKTLNKAIEQ